MSTGHELSINGIQRSYLHYRPTASEPEKLPLMIVLHGGLGNAESIQQTTAMNEIADTGPFMVAYPNGVKVRFSHKNRRLWNGGTCCGIAAKRNIDDVQFIQRMIADIGSKYPLDKQRVYVTGISNGAMLAYRLACEMPDQIAAIIPVAGTLAVEDCDFAKDIPVMHIHGTADKFVPIKGGMGSRSVAGVSHRSLSDTIALITRSRQCDDPKVSFPEPGIQTSSYLCRSGAPVVVVLIQGGGHVWPGGHGRRQAPTASGSFSASRQAWEFAKQFSKKTTT
jgi:polyhydroxybutyrate depolymerase